MKTYQPGDRIRDRDQFMALAAGIQIGSDYNHKVDDRFSHAHTPEEAWEMFRDAEKLHDASENSFRGRLWRQISALLSLLAPPQVCPAR